VYCNTAGTAMHSNQAAYCQFRLLLLN